MKNESKNLTASKLCILAAIFVILTHLTSALFPSIPSAIFKPLNISKDQFSILLITEYIISIPLLTYYFYVVDKGLFNNVSAIKLMVIFDIYCFPRVYFGGMVASVGYFFFAVIILNVILYFAIKSFLKLNMKNNNKSTK